MSDKKRVVMREALEAARQAEEDLQRLENAPMTAPDKDAPVTEEHLKFAKELWFSYRSSSDLAQALANRDAQIERRGRGERTAGASKGDSRETGASSRDCTDVSGAPSSYRERIGAEWDRDCG